MRVKDAISKRILNICYLEGISINKLALICTITQSTLENIVNGYSKNPKILTIVRICEGLDMKLTDFFNDPLFDNLDRED